MAKILVTGGAGFIGSHVSKKLLERGDEVVVVDNFNDYYDVNLKRSRIKNIISDVKVYELDIRNDLEKVFSENKFDKVCHLAAMPGVRNSLLNPLLYQGVNVEGTKNLLATAKKFDVNHFVMASSASVYGNKQNKESEGVEPISPYGKTKREMELLSRDYGNVTLLRLFTVYGPWGRPDMAYYSFAKKILENKPIEVYNNGNLKRDFTYIDDIVSGVLAALDKPFAYEIINLGHHQPVNLLYFIETLEKELGKAAQKKMVPMQPGDVKETWANIDKAKRLLDWQPKVSIEEGLNKFVKWFKEYYY